MVKSIWKELIFLYDLLLFHVVLGLVHQVLQSHSVSKVTMDFQFSSSDSHKYHLIQTEPSFCKWQFYTTV